MEEIKQSLRIIDQCLHEMPDGPIMAKLPRLLRPRPGRAWAAVEGPRGKYGAYAISDGTDQPFRLQIHDPSFIHLQAVGALLPGQPARRHDGDHGLPRSGHGRGRQVTRNRRGRGIRADRCPGKALAMLDPASLRCVLHARARHRRSRCSAADPGHPRSPTCRSSGSCSRRLVLLLLAPPIAFVIIYMEMKVIALMNLRIGPDRVGPWGSLLSTVHGLKVLMKEDFTPTRADAVVFTWAPVVVFAAAALTRARDPVRAGPVRPGLQPRACCTSSRSAG